MDMRANMRSHLEKAIESLGDRLGLELRLDGEGRAAVALDDVEIAMIYVQPSDEVQFYSPIGRVPEHGAETFLRILLSSNYMGRLTGRCALAVDPDGDEVSLNMRIPAEGLNDTTLETTLEQVASLAKSWQGAMPTLEEAAARNADEPTTARADARVDLDMIRV